MILTDGIDVWAARASLAAKEEMNGVGVGGQEKDKGGGLFVLQWEYQ